MDHKNEAGLSTQFPACLLCKRLVSFVFTTFLYVFLACPAEILPTLQLKTRRLPVLKGSVQVRSVMFMTGLFALSTVGEISNMFDILPIHPDKLGN